jgi:type II secretory pathway pseudopilin PulG
MVTLIRFRKTCQGGFTMLEAMLGFTIAAILLTATTPLLLIAVSTRVYNYQLEQAAQLAQAQINQVQAVMSQGVAPLNEGPLLPPPAAAGTRVSQVGAPTAIITDVSQRNDVNQVLVIDNNSDGQADFLVQVFRDTGVRFTQGSAAGQLAVFRMGVRVYSGNAIGNIANLSTQLSTVNFSSGLTQQVSKPLAVAYSEVSRSDLKLSLEQYRTYLTSNP